MHEGIPHSVWFWNSLAWSKIFEKKTMIMDRNSSLLLRFSFVNNGKKIVAISGAHYQIPHLVGVCLDSACGEFSWTPQTICKRTPTSGQNTEWSCTAIWFHRKWMVIASLKHATGFPVHVNFSSIPFYFILELVC